MLEEVSGWDDDAETPQQMRSGDWVFLEDVGEAAERRQQWSRDEHTEEWVEQSSGNRRSSLRDVLADVDAGAAIEVIGDRTSVRDVVAALPIDEDIVDGFDWDSFGVRVNGVDHGPFAGVGWLPLDGEHVGVPAHRVLVEMSHSEEGGFTSGTMRWLLGEVRPGLLVDHYDLDGFERSVELIECEESEYADRMRDTLSGGYELVELAVERALEEGPGWWTGDELDPAEGSPTATIHVDFDGSVPGWSHDPTSDR